MTKGSKKRIGILTGGGDCPGLNAVIRGVAKACMSRYHAEVIGIEDGFQGLVEKRVVHLNWTKVSGILTQGGTILGTNNKANPFKWPIFDKNGEVRFTDISDKTVDFVHELSLDALVCIGGDGTMSIAHQMSQKGIKIIGVPKTIDNDIVGTDVTFGFDTAVSIAAEAIDRIHTTAMSHHRVMVVEVMGRYAGWLALTAGVASGGDVILIPEIPYKLDAICRFVEERSHKGKKFSIVVVSEGAMPEGGERVVKRVVKGSTDPIRLGGIGHKVAHDIEDKTGLECRVTVLGHLQRGGTPTAYDRVLATRYAVKAAELCCNESDGIMVALKGTEIIPIPLTDVGGKMRLVSPDHSLIDVAKNVGTCMGI